MLFSIKNLIQLIKNQIIRLITRLLQKVMLVMLVMLSKKNL